MLSEYGYWGEELIGPLETFDAAGYQVDFMTPTGKRPVAITVSMDPGYIDPPLGRSVTSAEVAEKVKALDSSPRLDHPLRAAVDDPGLDLEAGGREVGQEAAVLILDPATDLTDMGADLAKIRERRQRTADPRRTRHDPDRRPGRPRRTRDKCGGDVGRIG